MLVNIGEQWYKVLEGVQQWGTAIFLILRIFGSLRMVKMAQDPCLGSGLLLDLIRSFAVARYLV